MDRALLLFTIAILLLAGWIVHSFLPALAWAVAIAVANWPAYERFQSWLYLARDKMRLLRTVGIKLDDSNEFNFEWEALKCSSWSLAWKT